MVGNSSIRAECSSTGLNDYKDLRTMMMDMRQELVAQRKELVAQSQKLVAQSQEHEKHKTALSALAFEKVVRIAQEILVRSAHRRLSENGETGDVSNIARMYNNIVRRRHITKLLHKSRISHTDFTTKAMALRSTRNDIAHAIPDLITIAEQAKDAYSPILSGIADAEFAVFVVKNAVAFLNFNN